jgi:hypothetical protein
MVSRPWLAPWLATAAAAGAAAGGGPIGAVTIYMEALTALQFWVFQALPVIIKDNNYVWVEASAPQHE